MFLSIKEIKQQRSRTLHSILCDDRSELSCCRIRVSVLTSFGYTSEEVNYTWFRHEDGGIGCYIDRKNNNVDHLGFYLMGVELKSGQSLYGGANYSSLETVIYLKRKYSAYVMQVYITHIINPVFLTHNLKMVPHIEILANVFQSLDEELEIGFNNLLPEWGILPDVKPYTVWSILLAF